MGTGDGGELRLTSCPGRLGLVVGSSFCGGQQHVLGRLGRTGQGHTAEPDWYCLGRRLGLRVQWRRDGGEGRVRWT